MTKVACGLSASETGDEQRPHIQDCGVPSLTFAVNIRTQNADKYRKQDKIDYS